MSWYKNVKTAQFNTKAREARYRGTIVYEVYVPENGMNPDAEQAAAKAAADSLYTQLFQVVGDKLPLGAEDPQKISL